MTVSEGPEPAQTAGASIPIIGVRPDTMPDILAGFGPSAAAFAQASGFRAEAGQVHLVAAPDGALAAVLFGLSDPQGRDGDPFAAGKLATVLPPGTYRLDAAFPDKAQAAMAFARGLYRFDRFRKAGAASAQPVLETPEGVDGAEIKVVSEAIAYGRDLINRPANDLGPDAFEAEIRGFSERHGAEVAVVRGDDLIAQNYPLIHAVGRAAAEPPRLCDISWGEPHHPRVTLVGKGVCFDTGGLDIKPSSAMLLMKKDMGGAAVALSLAAMVIGAGLAVRLRVLIPVVENAISGAAFRPGDILSSRRGLHVEIGNTDAEGRLVLADALTAASEDAPDLVLDFATLTGAARVALGPDLPPFFTDDDDLAASIARHAQATNDPCWRMPLWSPYDAMLKSKVADLNNAPGGPFAGAITAALFLRRFAGDLARWAHFDVYGWNPAAKPGRPEGGEVQTAHALFAMLRERYAGSADDAS